MFSFTYCLFSQHYVFEFFRGLQWIVKRVLEHIAFRLITVVLILLDFIFVIVELADDDCNSNKGKGTLELLSHILISYFMLEVFFRIFYQGYTYIHCTLKSFKKIKIEKSVKCKCIHKYINLKRINQMLYV